MTNKLFKSFVIFLIILGISFSSIPFDALTFLIDNYEKTSGIVDKIWLVEQNHDGDVVDKFTSLRNISDKLRIHEAQASTFIAVSNYNSAGSASALVNKPAGTVDNDIMFALIMRNNNGAVNSVPAGWNLIANHQYSTTYHQMLYWKLAAGEGASYTWGFASSGKTAITIATYRGGFNTSNPIDVVSNTEFITTPNTTVRAASMNVSAPNSSLIWFGTLYSTTVRTWTKPSIPTTGWVENYDGGATTSDFSRTIDSMVWAGSGATGNMDGTVVTGGTTVKHAFAVALRPPAGNNPPTFAVTQPDGTGDTVTVGQSYNITYNLSDAEDAATVDFYYDNDINNGNGYTAIASCQNQIEGTGAVCSWNTTGMTPGSYYIYGIATDLVNPDVNDYSPGVITIDAAVPDATGFVNNTEASLLDGGRSGQQITISGSNFGTVSSGSRANCSGGAGTGCIRFIVGGNATVADADITAWSDASITFTVNASLASYGGLASLQMVSAGVSDGTPLDFYVYPNITSAPANGQIGSEIAISGNHFGTSSGSVTVINNPAAVIGVWSETNLTVRIPGQQGVGITSGKIRLARSDAKISNQYPAGNFTIDGPIITNSSSSPVTNGQTGMIIHFNGSGIDTDTTPTNTRPIFWLKKTGEISIPGDSVGANYGVTTAYSDVYATFDLSGAVAGTWNLELTNMDGQVSTCLNCLTINDSGPTVTNITPTAGFDFEISNNISIDGSNFDTDATVKFTMTGEIDLNPSTAFTRISANLLNGGAFDFTAKKNSTWTVVVTNVSAGKSGSYSGFTVNSAIKNIYQFATNTDNTQPPTEAVPGGGGIGNQSNVYFRLDMDSNKSSSETLIPEMEAQLIGTGFQCILSNCPEKTSGFFAQASLPYSGASLRNWLNISGITSANDGDYHWRIRLTNSSGKIGSWIEFGTDPQATNVDFYLDNTPPVIGGECPAINISDSQATADWNTDVNSTAQVEYKLGVISESWITPGNFSPATPKPVEASPHTITLSGLIPGSDYVFRVRSKDDLGNEVLSINCAFTTGAAMPIKTIELFIMQEEGFIENTQTYYPFTVSIPESNNNPISVKSAIIEINGISGAAANNQTINIGFLRGSQTIGPLAGTDFTIESTLDGSIPFTILFDALNPTGPDQGNMNDLTLGGYANSKTYTLFLKGSSAPSIKTYIPGAKLILTYSYTP